MVFDPIDMLDRPVQVHSPLLSIRCSPSASQAQFIFDLQERLRVSPEGLPYELRALEAVLLSVSNALRDQYNLLSPKVAAVLRRMEGRIDKSLLLNMLDLNKKLTRLESRVTGVRDAMIEILNSNDDMYAPPRCCHFSQLSTALFLILGPACI